MAMGMLDEFDKCRFCKYWDDYDGNMECWCEDRDGFEADKRRIIEKAKEMKMSIADVVALIELG
jgi:hypothetical protein